MRLFSEIVARSTTGKTADAVKPHDAHDGGVPLAADASLDEVVHAAAPDPLLEQRRPDGLASAGVHEAFEPDAHAHSPADSLAEQPRPAQSEAPAASRREMAQEAMRMLTDRAGSDPQDSGGGSRAKTRLLGFGGDAAVADDPFDAEAPKAGATPSFPVGWLVVTSGPGTGASFALQEGAAQIGRGADQAISLDFGDTAISRANHAAIAYDSELNAFYLGHGGKTNIVRLNNKPVLSTEELASGDEIRIGETELRFVALCGDNFTWAASQAHG